MITQNLISFIESMKHSPAHNYVIPGLTSWLIGSPHPAHGCVRLFTMSREHEESIVPHSHRFDFHCLVLRGKVTNNVWSRHPVYGDDYAISDVTYEGVLGEHRRTDVAIQKFSKTSKVYVEGDEYAMKAEQFHSIYFEKASSVLFFEGVNRLGKSQILEPVVMGDRIPLFKTEHWMFRKDNEESK